MQNVTKKRGCFVSVEEEVVEGRGVEWRVKRSEGTREGVIGFTNPPTCYAFACDNLNMAQVVSITNVF
jgi:hypothetical protein